MREEKMEQLRIHQEERVRRALERAQAEPKKKVSWGAIQWKYKVEGHMISRLYEFLKFIFFVYLLNFGRGKGGDSLVSFYYSV